MSNDIPERLKKLEPPEEVIASERKLIDHGSVKIVSLWWSDPHVIGVLADGRRLIVATPEYHPTEQSGPPASLVEGIKNRNLLCEECNAMDREREAVGAAYCCGRKAWWAACSECMEEFGGHGPEDCP